MPESNEQKPKRTTDERIDAIAMNLELLGHDVSQLSHEVRELSKAVVLTNRNVDRILGAVERLVEIATNHEHRLSGLEGTSNA